MLVSERSWKARFLEAKVLAPRKASFPTTSTWEKSFVFRMSRDQWWNDSTHFLLG
jgi:hypothetical protein